MAKDEKDYSHRSVVDKLGVEPGQRVEITGDVGPEVRRAVKERLGRGLVKSGEVDGAIVSAQSLEEGEEILKRYRSRLLDSGYLWLITRKRGQDAYVNQMEFVPAAKKALLIDNKTCSIDDKRSGIRFVIPRRYRRS